MKTSLRIIPGFLALPPCVITLALAWLALCAPLRAEDDAPQLLYARPEKADASVEEYQVTTWTPGTRLFVAPLRINLRARPDVTGESAGKLAMGDPVVVQAIDAKRKREDGLVNHWYQVKVAGGALKDRSGWAYGAHLTPFALQADLDGNKQDDLATVSFDSAMKIHVRVLDRTGGTEEHVAELALTPSGEGFLSRKGGQVSASVVPARQAGVALIKLSSMIEACGDYYDAYVSYAGGKAHEALMLRGVNDPPVSQTTTVKFSPGKAEVTEVVVQQDEKGKEEKKVTRTKMVFEKGVFRETK